MNWSLKRSSNICISGIRVRRAKPHPLKTSTGLVIVTQRWDGSRDGVGRATHDYMDVEGKIATGTAIEEAKAEEVAKAVLWLASDETS